MKIKISYESVILSPTTDSQPAHETQDEKGPLYRHVGTSGSVKVKVAEERGISRIQNYANSQND